ncbi:MAG: hypothetical protein A3C22_01120 [Candidatus Levybacteria bacterium RIFCSPHIGHO2_02_FULL_37_10]|nr:MAG: hypothetical protein A3C22_01120 [Candidatus Levybacteria bacterium RIFCSPHIGHO2_02_FULL_37_10]OGH42986.1 MAG: hypothetical protein A3B53_03020 [Candidatus Levybacteria bacterium RIFCSPLOWO2_01_FULL_42_15]
MSNDNLPAIRVDGSIGIGEVESTEVGEVLRHPRVLVMGSNMSGGANLRNDLEVLIKERGFDTPVEYIRDIDSIMVAFFNQQSGETLDLAVERRDVPDYIVLFAEMRRYDDRMGSEFVSTQAGGDRSIQARVDKLCNKYGVDLWVIDRWPLDGPKQVTTEAKKPGFLGKLSRLIGN